MLTFEWGVAVHDLDFDGDPLRREVDEQGPEGPEGNRRQGPAPDPEGLHRLAGAQRGDLDRRQGRRASAGSTAPQAHRTGGAIASGALLRTPRSEPRELDVVDNFRETFVATVKANFWANVVRNVWSNAIIFCGHFPDQTYVFNEDEVRDEQPGGRYVRQLIGAANINGSPMFHIMSGNLGYQVEHHLYPDMPSSRYGEIAPRVREICKRYGLPYNTGPFSKQWGSVQRTILRLAFPGGKPRPKPGPMDGRDVHQPGRARARDGSGGGTRRGRVGSGGG